MAAHSPSIVWQLTLTVLLLMVHEGVGQQQTITIQPSSSTEFVGDSVLLLCSITDKEGAVTWVKDGTTAISSDRTIIDPTQTSKYQILGDDIAGSFNLNILDLTEDDSGDYVCRVSAAGTSTEVASDTATLIVEPIPVQAFVTEPTSAQATTDNSAVLQCVIENKEGNVEWVKDGVVISNNTQITDSSLIRYSITGTAADGEYNLQIVTVEMSDAGTYRCQVTAAGNSAAITSGDALLTVRDSSEVQSIVVPPSDKTATVGTSVTLVCYVSALSGSVRWLKDGVQISENRELVNGDTSGRISIIGNDEDGEYNFYISEVEDDDQALYFCVLSASDTDSSVASSPATLTVSPAEAPNSLSPTCTLTPSENLSENDAVTLTCESTGGTPQPTLRWSNDVDANADSGNQTQDSSSATNTLSLILTKDLSGVVYTCRSTHPAYSEPVECSLSPLDFQIIATINVTLDVSTLTIEEDKQGMLVCSAAGDPPVLGYTWYYNGAEIVTTDERFLISTTNSKDSSTLTIVSATLSMDESTIQCRAHNRIDERTDSVLLKIKEDNLTTYVLAALGLIATIIFVAIVVGFIIWVCYRMKKKNQKVYPDHEAQGEAKRMPNTNYFIGATNMGGTMIPNGTVVKTENEETKKKHRKHKDRKHRKHRKEKKDKSKVLDHDASRTPNPLSTRDGDHEVLPTITGYKRPGASSRDPGVYPTYPAGMYPIDGHSPLPHYQDGYPAGEPNAGRRSSVEKSGRRSSKDAKISLSPGEYQARDEYERKLRELQGLRSDLVNADEEKKKKKKHKKHKKDVLGVWAVAMAGSRILVTLARVSLLCLAFTFLPDRGFGTPQFTVKPGGTFDRFVGDSISLPCAVSGLTQSDTLVWLKDDDIPLSRNRDIIDPSLRSKYNITDNAVNGSFNLHIADLFVNDSGTYQCWVSGSGARIGSTIANLTVLPVPVQVFTITPSDTIATTGTTARMLCSVSNKEGVLEWLKNGVVISRNGNIIDSSLSRFNIVDTERKGTYNLQIVLVQGYDAARYSCRVTAAGRSTAIASSEAVLEVRDGTEETSILIPPSDTTATVGTSVTLVCRIQHASNEVEWSKDGTPITIGRNVVPGTNSDRISITDLVDNGEYNLHISDIEEDDAGKYICAVDGLSTPQATLTVLPASEPSAISPECSITPSSNLRENDKVTLSCESTGGAPQPTLTWSNDLDAQRNFGNQTVDSSSTVNSFPITLSRAWFGVVFTCRSTHPTYDTPRECVLPPLSFEIIGSVNITVDTDLLTIEEGKSAEITCSAIGDPPVIRFTWYYSGAELVSSDSRFEISTTQGNGASTLTIISATLGMDDSSVQCEARNRIDARRASVIIKIKVYPDPELQMMQKSVTNDNIFVSHAGNGLNAGMAQARNHSGPKTKHRVWYIKSKSVHNPKQLKVHNEFRENPTKAARNRKRKARLPDVLSRRALYSHAPGDSSPSSDGGLVRKRKEKTELSPREHKARVEFENRVRELQKMKNDLVSMEKERRKNKGRKQLKNTGK
ncbi:uncharacterized protein [Diadema antillarum]|uniref:uncharacterized protein n=1 Tax=Diadema antillarum TaxID=105358 RepID=UPI003A862E4C